MDHHGDQDPGKRPSESGFQVKYMKSASQLQILEEAYRVDPRPTSSQKESLARKTGLDYFRVQYWFGNRRYYDRHGPRRHRPKNDYNHLAGGESMQVPPEFNSETTSGTLSMNIERVEPSNISESWLSLVSGSVHNVLNPMPLRSFMPPGAFMAEPSVAQATPLPSSMTQGSMLPVHRKLQQPVTDAEDEFWCPLRAGMLNSDTKLNLLTYNAFQASLENMEPKGPFRPCNSEGIEGSCLEPVKAPISLGWFESDSVMIPLLDSERQSDVYEQHCLPMKRSYNVSVSSTNILNYGRQTSKDNAHVDSALPFQSETSNFTKRSPHGVLKMASSLIEYQKGKNVGLPNYATHDLNGVPKMCNPFYPSDKATHRDCNSFRIKNKQMHRLVSSGINGFQQIGHGRFSFKAAARNANNKHHNCTVQNLRKSHPSRWPHHGLGYDGFIVMPRGGNLPKIDDSPRPIIVKWNQKEQRATQTMDDSDNTLSMSSGTEAILADEYDDDATTGNAKGYAGGKSTEIIGAADEETGNIVKGDAKGKSVEVISAYDAADEDAKIRTEDKLIEVTSLDDEDCSAGEDRSGEEDMEAITGMIRRRPI